MDSLLAYIKANWKTNLAALCAFIYSVPQFVTALQQWQAGQTVDWKGAVISLILAAGLAAAKDGTNHSTQSQVAQATIDKPATPVVPKGS